MVYVYKLGWCWVATNKYIALTKRCQYRYIKNLRNCTSRDTVYVVIYDGKSVRVTIPKACQAVGRLDLDYPSSCHLVVQP